MTALRKRLPAGARVLVVAPQPFYEDRGTPIAVHQLLEALSHLGHRVDLVTYPIGEDRPVEGVRYFRSGNPLRIRSVPIGFSLRKIALDVSLVRRMRACLRENRYDFIHAVEEAAFAAAIFGRRRGIPVIYDMQSSIPEQLTKRLSFRQWPVPRLLDGAERWLLHQVDAVIGSAGLAERVHERAPETLVREWRYASPVTWTPPEDVRQARAEMQLADGTPGVVYCGNFAPYQGVTELLTAISLVRRDIPSARLVLIGASGAEGAMMEEEITARRLRDAVVLLPRQPRDRVARFLAAADVLVSPRMYGGNLPLKVFDYLAAGRPIVATDIPTHRSVLTEEMAFLVPPRASALAGAIVRAICEPARSEGMAQEGRAYAERNLGWMGFVESVDELYASVAHS